MPAEWEPHAATWLVWPRNRETWPGKLLKEVESIYLQMISALLAGEKVNLLIHDKKTAGRVIEALDPKKARIQNLFFHEVTTVDTWIRDYGPIFVKKIEKMSFRRSVATEKSHLLKTEISRPPKNGGLEMTALAFTKWRFNAWGGKYSDLARDNGAVDRVAALKAYERCDVPMVLEGGSIDVNGRGACLTTEQCLLNSGRNPKLTRGEVEEKLVRYLGITKVIWLKKGIEGDDTDGHVDDIARFVGPTTVLAAVEKDAQDPNCAVLEENFEILRRQKDQDGKRLRVIELPMPGYVYNSSFRASGANTSFRVAEGDEKSRSYSPKGGPPSAEKRDLSALKRLEMTGECGISRPSKSGGLEMTIDPRRFARLPASYANFYVANTCVLAPVYGHPNDREALRVIRRVFSGRKVVGINCRALVYGLGAIHCVTQQEPQ